MSDTCEPTGFIPPALGEVSFIVMIVLIAVIAADICVAKLTKCPSFLLRIQANAAFLREYERRLDSVVSYDVLKAYRLGRKLGAGVTSEVFKVEERTSGTKFAMKKIPLKNSESLTKAVEEELEILGKLRHHHVVELHETFRSPTTVWVVLELVVGGELANYVMSAQTWNEAEAGRCMHQVLSGMAYLHSQGVCHRDIKLANLLRNSARSDFTIKIADFGASKILPDLPRIDGSASRDLEQFKTYDRLHDAIGTPCNMGPEVFDRRYGPMCDMWSCGCVVYELLTGEPPFDPYKLPENNPAYYLKKNVRAGVYPTSEIGAWRALSANAVAFVQSLLAVNPKSRMSAWEALDHPWLNFRLRAMHSVGNLNAAQEQRKKRRDTLIQSGASSASGQAGSAGAGGKAAHDAQVVGDRKKSVLFAMRDPDEAAFVKGLEQAAAAEPGLKSQPSYKKFADGLDRGERATGVGMYYDNGLNSSAANSRASEDSMARDSPRAAPADVQVEVVAEGATASNA